MDTTDTTDTYSAEARLAAARALFDVLNPGIRWSDADAPIYLTAVDQGLANLDPNGSGDLFSELQKQHPVGLHAGFTSIKIEHDKGRVFFVTVRRTGEPALRSEIIERVDLSFIDNDDHTPMFTVRCSPNENAQRFLEKLDAYALINCVDLFTSEAAAAIAAAYEAGQVTG